MLSRRSRPRAAALTAAVGLAVLTGCTVPSTGSSAPDPSALVLADAYEPGSYNPVSGYGELGVSPLYDGLLALDSKGDDALPTFRPALAAAEPVPNTDFTSWTVPLRKGVTFHDGSAFDVTDVVATYEAVLDPDSGSPIASSFAMVEQVVATPSEDWEAVTFTLTDPYVDFPSRLLLAIAPSERLTGGPATESTLNADPVGTGPYRLAELTADRAVFTANPDYWGGEPQVSTLTTVHLPDDNTRVQRVAAGEFDGTIIPPVLASVFEDRAGYEVVAAQSADWRGVSLPADAAFTADPRVRIALNHAVDRAAMVDVVLAGHGRPAHTPVSPVYGDAYDPAAAFPYDPAGARRLLAEAGWMPGEDGILAKDGERAAFTVAYRPTDTLRRDLATAFTADMERIGVEVRLEGLDYDRIEPRIEELGILLGGGEKPYSLDTQVYATLHSPIPGTAIWDNPGGFGSPALDAALEQARRTADEPTRTDLYRQVQTEYLADPSYVFLVFLDHTYAVRTDDWQHGPLAVEPHAHGVGWGPWWDLASWTR